MSLKKAGFAWKKIITSMTDISAKSESTGCYTVVSIQGVSLLVRFLVKVSRGQRFVSRLACMVVSFFCNKPFLFPKRPKGRLTCKDLSLSQSQCSSSL